MDPETTLTATLTVPPTHTERLAADAYLAQRTSWTSVHEDDVLTEPCMALTIELNAFDAPAPLAEPLSGDPAYLVEARPPAGGALLVAVRATLHEAVAAAGTVHPGVADVVVREMPLPCDAESLVRVMGAMRTWSREPDGSWWPPLPDRSY
jgi:hypothetical protein